ncbi:MAG: DegT/DnrJ/EryC1/StrS family aminotransferase [Synergistaceae bacterium]|nr:DegT/DnrJ/EryC1/StrS family aminotransferase [Synergistaceae bacterium]MBR0278578.1 DegT/DnrJ/EryC1/StrS family aminotransferase [Synergistaceae bacterium]
MTVPILDLSRSFGEIKPEVFSALERIFNAQSFILGQEVKTFEAHCDSYLGVPEGSCVGCASGTDALLLALMSCDVHAGDEVITTPFTFFATSGTIARLGAVPVFADVDAETYNINIEEAMTKITPKTKIFLPVHLFGQMTPIEGVISEFHGRGILTVEDTAQAFGAVRFSDGGILRAGTLGDVGCYSFFPTKNLGGCGDGGMVLSRDPERAERLRRLRVHGSGTTYYHDEIGINSRLDAIQAAILDIKLKHLASWNEERRKIADYYKLLLKANDLHEFVSAPVELEGNNHIYHQYVVRVKSKRDELMNYLNAEGFAVRVYYPLPLHLQPCFKYLGYKAGDFPVSERLSREVLALPVFPGLKAEEQEALISAMRKFFRK